MAYQIYLHNPEQPHNLFLRNIIQNQRLEQLLLNHSVGEPLRVLNIWGAKYDKNRVDYHLGHIYVLQKLRDIASQTAIKNHIYIGINPSTEFIDQERRERQSAYIFSTEQLLYRTIQPANQNELSIHNCVYAASQQLEYQSTHQKYSEIIDKLNQIYRPEVAKMYAQNPSEVDEAKIVSDLGSQFGIDATTASELAADFRAFWKQGKHWLLTSTERLLRLQIFTYVHLVAKPHIVLVSVRHEHHWRCYRAIFRLAGLTPFPELVLLDAFTTPNEANIMQSGMINTAIFVMDRPNEIKDKLADAAASFDSFLPQCYNYIIFPNRDTIDIFDETEHTIGAITPPWDLQRYKQQGFARYLFDTCKREIPPILDGFRIIVNDAKARHIAVGTRWLHLTNVSAMHKVNDWLGNPFHHEVTEYQETLDRHPEALTNFYWNAINLIAQKIESMCRDFDRSPRYLPELLRLIRSTQNMDYYIWLNDKRYRDHFSHMLNVGCCGQILLDTIFPSNQLLRTVIADSAKSTPLSDGQITAIWWLAALLHDHAYPISYYLRYIAPRISVIRWHLSPESPYSEQENWKQMNLSFSSLVTHIAGGKLRHFLENLPEQRFSSIQSYQTYVCDHLRPLVLSATGFTIGRSEAEMNWDICVDHGVLACINVFESTGSNSNITKSKSLWRPIDFLAHAISIHNHKLQLQLSFQDNPFAFLLILSDEIQEWGRNALSDEAYEHPVEAVMIGPFVGSINAKPVLASSDLVIRFLVGDVEHREKLKWSIERFEEGKRSSLQKLKLPLVNKDDQVLIQSLRYELMADGTFGSVST